MPGYLQIAWRCLKQSGSVEDRRHPGRPGTSFKLEREIVVGESKWWWFLDDSEYFLWPYQVAGLRWKNWCISSQKRSVNLKVTKYIEIT
jgi:hypothetical protein